MTKRFISLVMAICMLCGLALNGIALPVSVSATDTTPNYTGIEETIVIENDVPTGWVNYNSNSDDSTCRPAYTIEDDVAGGNGKVLKLYRETNSGGTNGKIYQFDETQKVTLEYRVKSDVTSGASSCFFLPSFVYNDGSYNSPMWLFVRSTGCLYKEDMTFSDGGSQWALKKASYSADGWNSVKCELDLASSTPSIKLWMNGTEVSLKSEAYNLQSDLQITGFMIGSSVGAKGTVYLDDLTVTTGADNTEIEETTVIENDVPTGWVNYNSNSDVDTCRPTYAIAEDVAGGNGKVLTLSRETASGGNNGKIYQFAASKKVTLEYRVKSDVTSGATSCFFLPSFVYDDSSSSPMWLFARSTGFLYKEDMTFSDGGSQWAKKTTDPDTWYTVKCVVDLTKESIRLWVAEGEGSLAEVSLKSEAYNLQSDLQITGFMIGSSVGAKGTVYLDDLTVTLDVVSTDIIVSTEEELKAAVAEGGSIAIVGDITLTEAITVDKTVTISAENPVTITVNIAEGKSDEAYGGFLVTTGTLILGENITVTNTSPDAQGVSTIASTGADAKVFVDGATVTSATKHNAIEAANGSYVAIQSGHVYGQQYTAAYASGGATIKLEGGKVGHEDYACYGLIASSTAATEGGNIVIAGGEVTYVLAHEAATSNVTVSGGTVTKYVKADNKGNVTITGGTINEVRASDTAGTIAISGGTFTTAPAEEYLADGYAYDPATGTVSLLVTDWEFKEATLKIPVGSYKALKPVFTPAEASTKITYKSNDETVATVDENGVVTGVKEGTATITATPAQAGLDPITITVTVSRAAVPTYIIDFEDITLVDDLPEGWIHPRAQKPDGKTAYSLIADPDDSENQILKVTQTETRSSWYEILYQIDQTNLPVTVEYRYKVEAGTNGRVLLPSLVYKGESISTHTWPILSVVKDSTFYYAFRTASLLPVQSVEMKIGEWHTVKFTVDIAQKACELYLDGTEIALNPNVLQFADDLTHLSGITFGLNNDTIGTAYLDDMAVYVGDPCEKLDFAESLSLPTDGTQYLEPVFTPDTAYTRITYTSSDDTVATVDGNGMVTGIKEGTAIITAVPADSALGTFEIEVTVTGLVQGTIAVTVPEDKLSLPVGGHDDLNASFEYDGDFTVDSTLVYESSNTEVATVDEYGEILAVGAGTAKITVQSVANPSITREITVTVLESQVMRTIYVSPNGTGDGSSAAAPTTLEGALAILESIPTAQRTGNIEIILADGYYYRTETLALTDAHSGSNLYSVIFKAAEGANVTIGGGMHIEGSKFTDENNDGIYEYDLSSLNLGDDFNTRQLFVDNVRATRARGRVVPAKKESVLINGEYMLGTDGKTKIGFICDNRELLNLDRPQDLELVYLNNWIGSRCQVKEIKEVGGRVYIYMDEEPFNLLTSKQDFKNMNPDRIVYYENALELLDEGGEWYLNSESQTLYYMPRAWENMDDVTVTLPVFDNWDKTENGTVGLVTVTGTDFHQQAHNIRFEGITFADITWLRPDTMGLPTDQNNYVSNLAGKYRYGLADAAITVKMANSISFLDCNFTRLGSNGINLYDGVQNSLIQGCHFYDISAGAVGIGQPAHQDREYVDNFNPSDPKKMMKNVDVVNNYIHDTSVEYQSAAAISVGFAVNLDLSYNEIFNIPYSAFHIGYGWERVFTSYTKGIMLENNFIHDYMHGGLYDGGGIYVNGNAGGRNIASGNYLLNQGERYVALYADTGTDWWAWYGNVVDVSRITEGPTTDEPIYWSNPLSGNNAEVKHDNESIGNYYAGVQRDFADAEESNVYYADNTRVELDADGKPMWPTEAQAIIAASGLEEAYAGLRNDQIERIVIPGSDEDIELDIGETFAINLSGTDGKDKPVDITKATIAYESLNTDVATVDANGVITAVGKGTATVRVHVVSNDIWDVVELSVVIGDNVTVLKLEDVEGTISLFETAGDRQLVAYGVTEKGRQVSFDTVTWTIDDETVATVDTNGLLKVVGAGETTLTVTGQKGAATVSATYTIVSSPAVEWENDYMDELFEEENADKWYHVDKAGYFTITDGEKIDSKVTKGKTYTGKKFENELLTFRMSVTDYGAWPSIVLRSQDETKTVGLGGSTGYLICVAATGIELHRFNNGVRTQWYGPVADPAPILGSSITPNPLNDNELHEIQVGAQNEGDGVRLVMYIDGKEIFNILDDLEGAITDAGYFGLVGWSGDLFTLEKIEAPEISQNSLSLKGNIGVNYYTIIPDDVKSDPNAFIRFTMADGEVIETPISEGEEIERDGVTYSVFTCQVSAKEMADEIKAQIFFGRGLSTEENTYSVKEYAEYVLNDTTGAYDAWKPLMKAMLQYGAFAQKQFGYNADNLVTDVSNADLSSVTLDTLKQYRNTGAGTAKAKFYGASLILRSETTMSVFFQVEEGAALTVKYGDSELEVHERGEFKYVDIENISAKNLCDAFTLTVSDGTDTAEITAYPLGYCYNVLSNAETYGEPLVSLAKALYLYHVEAKQMLG